MGRIENGLGGIGWMDGWTRCWGGGGGGEFKWGWRTDGLGREKEGWRRRRRVVAAAEGRKAFKKNEWGRGVWLIGHSWNIRDAVEGARKPPKL
jgi:hypothetical protein